MSSFALGKNVFANVSVWQGEPRCHIRYHKPVFDESNRIVYQPTKSGICLNYQQLLHLSNNIARLVSEMDPQNKENTPTLMSALSDVTNTTDATDGQLSNLTHSGVPNLSHNGVTPNEFVLHTNPPTIKKRRCKKDARDFIDSFITQTC